MDGGHQPEPLRPSPAQVQPASPSRELFETEIRYPKGGVLTLVGVTVFGAIVFAGMVRLDRVVPARGIAIPVGGPIYIESLDNSLIRNVNVSAGDVVKKGQLLATVDVASADAEMQRAEEQYNRDAALVERLVAEGAGAQHLPGRSDPYRRLEADLLERKQREYEAQVRDLEARVAEAKAAYRQAVDSIDGLQALVRSTRTVEQMQQSLLDQGFGSKVALLKTTSDRIQAEQSLREKQGDIQKLAASLASAQQQRAAFIEQSRGATLTETTAAKAKLSASRAALEKARSIRQLTEITAPVNGLVVKVARVSSGSATAGPAASQEPLFTLVPLDRQVDVELQLDNRYVGFVRPGDPVVIKVDAFDFTSHGVARGKVKSITEATFTPAAKGGMEPTFKVRASVTEFRLRNVPADAGLIPGMTVTGDIQVGRRTILSYFVESLLHATSGAMREP